MNDASKLPRADGPYRIIGGRGARVDARDKVTGRALYADDLTLPGMLFGRLRRSPVAHGVLRGVDISRAEAVPGVRAILTGADLPRRYGILPVSQDETALAQDRVRYVGEPIAAVCADTEAAAGRAAALIDVDIDPLPTIVTLDDALAAPARIHESPRWEGNAHRVISLHFGDVDTAFSGSESIHEDVYYYAGSTHVPMETHATLADWDGTNLTLHVSHQAPYYLQQILPDVLGIPPHALRVVVPYVGGGFGGKLDPFPDTICAGKFAMVTGHPVKFTLSREEVFYNHRGRHPALMWIRTGWNGTRMTGMHFRAFVDGGAYGSFGAAAAYYHGALQGTTYRIPNYRAEIVRFHTNKPPCGPKRGHGTPQPRFAVESHLDRVAGELGVDAYRLRTDNLIRAHSVTVNHLRITSCGLDRCLESVVESSAYLERHGKLTRGQGTGLAVGCYLSGAALPIYWNEMPHSTVVVQADRSGRVTAFSGHTEIGQGADTVIASIVAECLGLEPGDVSLVLRDTAAVPPDLGSYSSRVTFMMGHAALEAARGLRHALAETAAAMFETAPETVVFADGAVHASAGSRRLSLAEVIRQAEVARGPLSFVGSYQPDVRYGSYKGAGVGPSPAYSYTACVVDVNVDLHTGLVRPTKVWIAHDIGHCINRTAVEGQVEGGVYMGLGEAMMEEMAFTKDGVLRGAGLLDYKTPTIGEMPEVETILIEDDESEGPYGAKEVGQGPLLPVIPAFCNAVCDAIGVRFTEIPVTPDKVLRALEKGQARVGPRRALAFDFPDPIRVEVPDDAQA